MSGFGARRCVRLIVPAAAIMLALGLDAHGAWAQVSSFGGPRPAEFGGVAGWILAQQAMFYRALAGMIRLARTDGSALWSLMGVSFVYGIFHAAGPGHGKAVISSYMVANEETWRRGITLSFASAVMQSLTAIAIVGVAAVLLGATAKLMGDTVNLIETVSYGLIVLLGARLLWVKGRGFRDAFRRVQAERAAHGDCTHAFGANCTAPRQANPASMRMGDVGKAAAASHFQCEGDHDHDELDVLPWGHAHGPEPAELAGPGGWRRGLSAVVAVGLRPCSGAIIVLVFALAQGLFWAGIASTFVMGLGTAITVGTIATLAVGARALAKRVATRPSGYGDVVMRGFEFAAGGLVLAFGILLLTGYMASERMGLF